MRGFWTIVAIIIAVYAIGISLLWDYAFYRNDRTAEYVYHSRSIEHSIEKGGFVDTFRILSHDTIFAKTVNAESDSLKVAPVDVLQIFPTEAWIEKTVLWKSHVVDIDSMTFSEENVALVILFNPFKDGKPYPPDFGFSPIPLFDAWGREHLVDIEGEFAVLSFILSRKQANDTLRLKTKDGQEIISVKY